MKIFILILLSSLQAFSFEDPTKGKPFFPWIWEDQFKPTLVHSIDVSGLSILGAGALGTIGSHQYDGDVYDAEKRQPLMDSGSSGFFATLGGGAMGVGITAVQLFVDQKNGLKHGRALVLTTFSHLSLSAIAQRHRPAGRDDYLPFASSWPSGHASSAFATAESLAYSYGWWVGVPMNAVAIAIAASRVSENAHWFSDVVSGAALGIFWAHASNNTDQLEPEAQKKAWQFVPVPFENGLGFTLSKAY